MSLFWYRSIPILWAFWWLPQQTAGQSAPAVRQIEITSGWTGLAAGGKTGVLISKVGPAYYRNDEPIPTDLVVALVKALKAPAHSEPRLEDLGITPAWLKANASSAAEKEKGASMNGHPVHVADLESMFADPVAMEPVALGLFKNRHTDDYPSVQVVVTFEDGSSLSGSSHSQFAFLLPWNLDKDGGSVTAYNADISRATAALMPENAKNRSRLAGESLVGLLAQAAMFQIEHKYQLLAVEDKTGKTFGLLRAKYSILSADIRQPSPQVNEASQEPGLHLSLKATDLPPNLSEEVILVSSCNSKRTVS